MCLIILVELYLEKRLDDFRVHLYTGRQMEYGHIFLAQLRMYIWLCAGWPVSGVTLLLQHSLSASAAGSPRLLSVFSLPW
jgi:hypothetical protein